MRDSHWPTEARSVDMQNIIWRFVTAPGRGSRLFPFESSERRSAGTQPQPDLPYGRFMMGFTDIFVGRCLVPHLLDLDAHLSRQAAIRDGMRQTRAAENPEDEETGRTTAQRRQMCLHSRPSAPSGRQLRVIRDSATEEW
jgi:hypothetical protein